MMPWNGFLRLCLAGLWFWLVAFLLPGAAFPAQGNPAGRAAGLNSQHANNKRLGDKASASSQVSGPVIFPPTKPRKKEKNALHVPQPPQLNGKASSRLGVAWPGRRSSGAAPAPADRSVAWPGRRKLQSAEAPRRPEAKPAESLPFDFRGFSPARLPGHGERFGHDEPPEGKGRSGKRPPLGENFRPGGKGALEPPGERNQPPAALPRAKRFAVQTPGAPPNPRLQRLLRPLLDQAVTLADRRAFYAARQRLLRALELLAQRNDRGRAEHRHQQALRRALLALEEAQDFVPDPGQVQSELDVAALAAGHQTPLAARVTQAATAQQALTAYYTYAQRQLVAALGRTPEASEVLSTLGKLYAYMAGEPRPLLRDCLGQALVFQQAALLADRNNAAAANELGVLLARLGRYEEALGWLSHSVRLRPESRTWHNLSVVYARLGRPELARRAKRWAQVIYQRRMAGERITRRGMLEVRWVAPEQFRGKPKTASASGLREANAPRNEPNTPPR